MWAQADSLNGALSGTALPLAPLLVIFASVAIAINQLRVNPQNSVTGLGLLLVGVPVYFFTASLSAKARAKNANH